MRHSLRTRTEEVDCTVTRTHAANSLGRGVLRRRVRRDARGAVGLVRVGRRQSADITGAAVVGRRDGDRSMVFMGIRRGALGSLVIAPGHAATQGFAWPVLAWYFVADITFGALASLAGSIVPGIVVHAIGLLIFFTLVWPADASRATVALGQADASFWLEVV